MVAGDTDPPSPPGGVDEDPGLADGSEVGGGPEAELFADGVVDGVADGVVAGAGVVGAGVVGAGVVGGAVAGCVDVDAGTVSTLVPVGLVLAGLALTAAEAGAVVWVTAEELRVLSPVRFCWLPEVSIRAMTAMTAQAAMAAPPAMSRLRVNGEVGTRSGSGSV